jgi:catechol 2,3-dioxygenase-like lactoylglutathione lyase family enzyme
MNLTGLVHVNINCRDYERSKAFYEMLGFEAFWPVPETNSPEVAAAVGMPPYRVKGALFRLKNANPPVVIDLLQWLEPQSELAPYETLYQSGLARLALSTSDLASDYRYLQSQNVEILSEPATVYLDDEQQHGSRFFCFKDPDGTFLELVESF